MKKQLKQLISQTAIYGLSSIVGRLLNYLLVPIHTRLFLPPEYGVVAELYAYIGFFFVLLTYGMETGFFRYSKDKNIEKVYSSTLTPLFFTSLFFILLAVTFSQSIANWLLYPDNKEYIIWLSIIIGLDAFVSIPFAYLRQQNNAIRFVTIKLSNIGIAISFNLFFLLFLPFWVEKYPNSFLSLIYDENIGVGYIFIANLIATIATLFFLIPEILFAIRKFDFDKKLFKEMLIYSLPLLFVGLATMINETFDRILLKHLIQVPSEIVDKQEYIMAQIGIYGANYKIAILMTLFIQTFRYAAEPFFFAQADKKNSKALYSNIMTYFVIFGLTIFLGVMFFIDIIKYFVSENYYSGLYIVPILLIAKLFSGIIYNLSIWYKLTNRTRYGAYIAFVGAISMLVFNVLLIPIYGFLGSAWAAFFSYLIMMVLSFFLGQKYFTVKYDLKRIFAYSFLALFIYYTSQFFIIENVLLKYSFRSVLLLVFLFVVIYKEKLYKLIIKNNNRL